MSSPAETGGKVAAADTSVTAPLTSDARAAVLAMPLLAERFLDEQRKEHAFRVSGGPRVISRTPRSGGTLLRLAVDIERRMDPSQPTMTETLLIDLLVDSAGQFVSAEPRGRRDADTRELEALLAR